MVKMHLFVSYIPFSKVDIVHRVTMERFGYSWKCRLVSLLSESLYTLIIVKCNNINQIYWYFVVSKYNVQSYFPVDCVCPQYCVGISRDSGSGRDYYYLTYSMLLS